MDLWTEGKFIDLSLPEDLSVSGDTDLVSEVHPLLLK